jgi:hypothetical protein
MGFGSGTDAGCSGLFPRPYAARYTAGTHDHGVNGVSPLDWHYARKNGFHKYN